MVTLLKTNNKNITKSNTRWSSPAHRKAAINWQNKKEKEGKCVTCGLEKEPDREDKKHCEGCAAKVSARVLANYYKRKELKRLSKKVNKVKVKV